MILNDNRDGTMTLILTTEEQATVNWKPGALQAYLTSWLISWGYEYAAETAASFKTQYDKLEKADQDIVLALFAKASTKGTIRRT